MFPASLLFLVQSLSGLGQLLLTVRVFSHLQWVNVVKWCMSFLELLAVNMMLIFRARMCFAFSRASCLHANRRHCSLVGNHLLCEHWCKSRRRDGPRLVGQGSIWENLSLEEVWSKIEKPVEQPSVEDFICILRKCRKLKNLAFARSLHKHIQENAHEMYQSLGNYVVPL
eukprot:c7858_g2_i1 orf=413-922(+)